jgi:hypothetical protein
LTNRDRYESLEAIRKSLMWSFHLSETSRPHFDQLEASAYTRLAASLVEADVSPCRSADVEVVAGALAEVYARREAELEEILQGYGYSSNDPILQQALRRALIQKLPHGTRVLTAHDVPSDLWPDALLITAYEAHSADLSDPAYLPSRDYFYAEFIPTDAEAAIFSTLQRIARISQRKTDLLALVLDRQRGDLRLRRTYLTLELAKFLRLEEARNWPRLTQ